MGKLTGFAAGRRRGGACVLVLAAVLPLAAGCSAHLISAHSDLGSVSVNPG